MITVVKISLIKLCSLPPGILIFVKLYFVLDVSFLVVFRSYGKIPKISPGAYIFQRSFFGSLFLKNSYSRRCLYMEGNLRYKIYWAS